MVATMNLGTNGAKLARRATIALVAVAFAAGGCSRPSEWKSMRPPTHAAGGVVTYRGQPVVDGLVVFLTNPSYEKWKYGEVAAIGVTDADGRFRLRTFQPGDGAVAGRHTVLVQKTTQATPDGKPVTAADLEPSADGTRAGIDPGRLVEVHHLPERYRLRDQTPFTADVEARGPNDFRFALD